MPPNQTKVTFTTPSEAPLRDGGSYGVGAVIVAHFDEPIPDRSKAEQQLTVTTSPSVSGAWLWVGRSNGALASQSTTISPHTTVTAEAKIYGIDLGRGLFGQEDSKVSFTHR